MREIKFRAWRSVSERMIDWEKIKSLYTITGVFDYPDVVPMQYTGLKDRNGKEIYEGDFVAGEHRSFENWVPKFEVKFHKGCFMFGNYNAHEYFNKHTKIEVIGNIYENPEPLGG